MIRNEIAISDIFSEYRDEILLKLQERMDARIINNLQKTEVVLNMQTGEAKLVNKRSEKLLLSKVEAAELLSVSLMSINRYLKAGIIPSITLGGRRLIPLEHLKEILNDKLRLERRK
jgi:excisionase family DNA binding protein